MSSIVLPNWLALPSHMLCLLAGVMSAMFWHQGEVPERAPAPWKKEFLYVPVKPTQLRGKMPVKAGNPLSIWIPSTRTPPCRWPMEKLYLAQQTPFPVVAIPLSEGKRVLEKIGASPSPHFIHAVEGEGLPLCRDKPEVRYGLME